MSCLNISNVSANLLHDSFAKEKRYAQAHCTYKQHREREGERGVEEKRKMIGSREKKVKRYGNMSVYQEPIVFESNNVNNLKVNRPT